MAQRIAPADHSSYFDDLIKSRFIELFGDPIENPKGWEKRKLRDLLLIERGGSPRPIDNYITEDSNGLNWIKIGDAQEGSFYIDSVKEKIRPEGLKKTRQVVTGDLILSNSMSFGRPYILSISGCIHDGWLLLRDLDGRFNKIFLCFALGFPSVTQAFKSKARGAVVNNLNKDLVGSLEFILPPKKLQDQFATFLEQVDKSKVIYEKIIRNLDNVVRSKFIEMFGDPFTSPKYTKVPFMDCLLFNPGKSELKDFPDKTEVSFVPMECVGTDGSIDVSQTKTLGEVRKGYTYFRDNDVVFAKITPCFENGKVALANNCKNGIGFGTTEFHVLRAKIDVTDPVWLQYLMKSESLRYLASNNMSGTAGQKRVQQPFFEKLTIGLPPIELQRQFHKFIEQVGKSKCVLLDKLKMTSNSEE